MYDKPLTREQYLDARWISEPLCLFDNCLETDGALAVVLVAGRAGPRTCPSRRCSCTAAAQGLPRQHQTMTNYFNDDPLRGRRGSRARQLWQHAEFGPADVKVAQIYDAFSPLVPLSLEGYGFCGRGEGGAVHRRRRARVARRAAADEHQRRRDVARRTSTASTSILEGVRQLRGTSTSQVAGADTCLVTSGEGVPTSALLLRN